MLQIARNAYYDPGSRHAWAELNETRFIESVLARVNEMLGRVADRYRFYVFSWLGSGASPASVDASASRKVLIYLSDEEGRVPREVASQECCKS